MYEEEFGGGPSGKAAPRFEEDYYTSLNLSRNATPEEISSAYRRLSKCYHPDKHTDPAMKKDAEILFNQVNKAYEVLSDPHKRAIYDSLGVRGLETEGWEVVLRTKTPQELREEYERLAREEEERRLLLRTNPTGNVTVHINATDLFNRYSESYMDEYSGKSLLQSVEVSSMAFTQSIETPLSMKHTVILGGQLSIKNGVGSGFISASLRRLLSQRGWFEVEFGAGDGPTVAFRGYRTLTKRIFFNGGTVVQFGSNNEIRPGLMGTLTMQLDTHTTGHLTYRAGIESGMNTTIVRSTGSSYTVFAIEFALLRSYISLSYTHKLQDKKLELKGCVKFGTFGWFVEYRADKKLSEHLSLISAVHVGVPTGVCLRLKVRRAHQSYAFPIQLCDEIFPAPVFYATVVPLFAWVLLKNFVIEPLARERRQRDKERQREANKKLQQEKQREARAAVDLMKATCSRIRAEEEAKRGLIISKALYGRFVYPQDRGVPPQDSPPGPRDEIIDVTIPLQCLVKDSKLVLHNASKSQLPGFYDPCVGEDKQLLIQYLFHMQAHECLLGDTEPLRIPKSSHRVNTT